VDMGVPIGKLLERFLEPPINITTPPSEAG
jgi:transposase